jgi:DNA-binding CsgD family transcriptional regulator
LSIVRGGVTLARDTVSGELIGRDEELRAAEGFLDGLEGGPGALLIEGEAGAGKTSLWEAAIEAGRSRGHRVLEARPAEAESSFAFAVLGDLLRDELHETARLPRPQRRALEIAFLLVEAEGGGPDPQAVGLAARGLLGLLAERAPVVVAVDDVQWVDPPSEAALRYVARRLGGLRIGLLLAARSPVDSSPFGVDRGLPEGRQSTLAPGPLSVGATQTLLRRRLDLVLPRPLLQRLHSLSGGNPFYALELGSAVARGRTRLDPGDPLPVSLSALVVDRLAALPRDSQRAAAVVAAASRPTRALLGALELEDALEPALAAGVIVSDRDELRPAHPLVGSAAYTRLAAGERLELHGRLAAAATDLEERARHLALSTERPDEDVAAVLDEAAALAASRGAPAVAAELAVRAAALTPATEGDAIGRRRLAAGRHIWLAGDLPRARTILSGLVEELPPGSLRAEALLELAWASGGSEVEELGAQALDEASQDPAVGSRIRRQRALLRIAQGDVAAARAEADMAVALAESVDDERVLAEALGIKLFVETAAGRPVDKALSERALELERRVPDLDLHYCPTLAVGAALVWDDQPAEARRMLEEFAERAGERGRLTTRASALRFLAGLELRSGSWARAAEHAAELAELTEQLEFEQSRGPAHYMEALVAAYLGDVELALKGAGEAAVVSAAVRDRQYWVASVALAGFVHLSSGDVGAAARTLGPLPATLARMGVGEPTVYGVLANSVEALVAAGELEQAAEVLDQLERNAEVSESRLGRCQALRCLGLLRAAHGDLAEGLEALERAAGEHETVPAPFERARTLVALGATQRRARRWRDARESLAEAVTVFEALGARLWAERAREELARVGGRKRGSGELTATEQRVAALVAEGRSTKEVAASLFVSAKTVEGHLSHIYDKLGVRSRTELAHRITAQKLG